MDLIRIGNKLCGAADSRMGGLSENQDSYLITSCRLGLILGVCDGCRSETAGKTASSRVCGILNNIAKKVKSGSSPKSMLAYSLATANQDLRKLSPSNPIPGSMNATCVFAIVEDKYATIANVGNCRCLQIRNGNVIWDSHTAFSGKSIDDFCLQDDAESLPIKALGAENQVDVQEARVALQPGDRLALMTDGVGFMMPLDILIKFLTSKDRPAEIVGNILDNNDTLGRDNGGGHDNMTMILLEIPSKDSGENKNIASSSDSSTTSNDTSSPRRYKGIWKWMAYALGVIVVVSVGLNVYWYLRDYNINPNDKYQKEIVSTQNNAKTSVKKSSGKKNVGNNQLQNVHDYIKEAINQLNELKNYNKNNKNFKFDKSKKPQIIKKREMYRKNVSILITRAAEKENSDLKKEKLIKLRDEIENNKLICNGIDNKQGLTTHDAQKMIDNYISTLTALK